LKKPSSLFNAWLKKLPRVRLVLERPEAPDDARLLHLFKNRAEIKKALGSSQDELHRLKDRIKLQEGATSRVREQLEQLESRLAAPMTGLHALLHYQLRDLWSTGHAQIATLIRDLAQQREDRERRQFLADLNRQLFERQQSARAECTEAEHAAADARARAADIQNALSKARSWWQYFKRRDLAHRAVVMQSDIRAADEKLQQVRDLLVQIEEQGGARYPGLSLQARRVLNLSAIAVAQLLVQRVPPALMARVTDAMGRSEPAIENVNDAAASLALMLEIGRTKGLLMQNGTELGSEVRRIVDSLAAGTKYRLAADTTPTAESVKQVLKADVLGEDLWSLSDLFYGEAEESSRAL
jgi:predicted  nucleic acid-binding Zn-ribbon protein